MENVVRKRKKFILIILILLALILILCILFGAIDYIRLLNGKKPIFINHTVNSLSIDIPKEGFEDAALSKKEGAIYYGIGYNVSICDIDTGNYIFKLGNKSNKSCFTSLTCNKTDDLNIKQQYEYSFFDDKLYRVSQTSQVPIESTNKTEKEYEQEIKKLNDVNGCYETLKKTNETTYEIVKVCNISAMSDSDIIDVYSASYKPLIDTGTTRDEVINHYHNLMTCE